jgi:hypothetical protein
VISGWLFCFREPGCVKTQLSSGKWWNGRGADLVLRYIDGCLAFFVGLFAGDRVFCDTGYTFALALLAGPVAFYLGLTSRWLLPHATLFSSEPRLFSTGLLLEKEVPLNLMRTATLVFGIVAMLLCFLVSAAFETLPEGVGALLFLLSCSVLTLFFVLRLSTDELEYDFVTRRFYQHLFLGRMCWTTRIDDSGAVAFTVSRKGGYLYSSFVTEQGGVHILPFSRKFPLSLNKSSRGEYIGSPWALVLGLSLWVPNGDEPGDGDLVPPEDFWCLYHLEPEDWQCSGSGAHCDLPPLE